jgi:hypothetical protein
VKIVSFGDRYFKDIYPTFKLNEELKSSNNKSRWSGIAVIDQIDFTKHDLDDKTIDSVSSYDWNFIRYKLADTFFSDVVPFVCVMCTPFALTMIMLRFGKVGYQVYQNNPFFTPSRGNLMVTGGLGYKGSHTVVEILNMKDKCGFKKIVIVDNLSKSDISILDKIRKLVHKKHKDDFVFEKMDLRN